MIIEHMNDTHCHEYKIVPSLSQIHKITSSRLQPLEGQTIEENPLSFVPQHMVSHPPYPLLVARIILAKAKI